MGGTSYHEQISSNEYFLEASSSTSIGFSDSGLNFVAFSATITPNCLSLSCPVPVPTNSLTILLYASRWSGLSHCAIVRIPLARRPFLYERLAARSPAIDRPRVFAAYWIRESPVYPSSDLSTT